MPLVPVTWQGDVMEILAHFLYDFVASVCVVVHRETKFVQSLDKGIKVVGDETLASVLRHSCSHPYLACLVHQGPGHWGPLRTQQAEGWKGLDTALDESLAPLVAAKMPELIHQGGMRHIQS